MDRDKEQNGKEKSPSYTPPRADSHNRSLSPDSGEVKSPRRSRSRNRSPSPKRRRNPSPDFSPRRNNRNRRERSRSRSPRNSRRFNDDRENAKPSRVLGVFGMSHRTDTRDLEDIFGRFGKIEDICIVKDHATKESRGFGFIYFDSMESARKARDELNGTEIHGRNVRTDYSVTKRPHKPTPGEYKGTRRFDRNENRNESRPPRNKRYYSRSRSRSRSRRHR